MEKNNAKHVQSQRVPGISFEQFVEIWTCVPSEDEGEEAVRVDVDAETIAHFREQFDSIDVLKRGSITQAQFQRWLNGEDPQGGDSASVSVASDSDRAPEARSCTSLQH